MMNIHDFQRKKREHHKITMVTCYDYPSALTIANSDIDCVLVGDSVAMAVHGYPTTLHATLEMIALHTQAVARGLTEQFLVSDLPFLNHKGSQQNTINAITQLMQAGAQAIKIEGGDLDTCKTIRHLVDAGIPVMGHIGLTPQAIHQLGGYKIQGKTQPEAERLLQQAMDLESAGCFAIVIECVPQQLAKTLTDALIIPTIGIGSGYHTDGQVLVWHDLLGLHSFQPKFVKTYAAGKELFCAALNDYAKQVQNQTFPSSDHAY